MKFNYYAFRAMYLHEMDRFKRTLMQSLFSPVLSTSLYFIVFGSVIGGYVEKIDGISYGSFIVPGLLKFFQYVLDLVFFHTNLLNKRRC